MERLPNYLSGDPLFLFVITLQYQTYIIKTIALGHVMDKLNQYATHPLSDGFASVPLSRLSEKRTWWCSV